MTRWLARDFGAHLLTAEEEKQILTKVWSLSPDALSFFYIGTVQPSDDERWLNRLQLRERSGDVTIRDVRRLMTLWRSGRLPETHRAVMPGFLARQRHSVATSITEEATRAYEEYSDTLKGIVNMLREGAEHRENTFDLEDILQGRGVFTTNIDLPRTHDLWPNGVRAEISSYDTVRRVIKLRIYDRKASTTVLFESHFHFPVRSRTLRMTHDRGTEPKAPIVSRLQLEIVFPLFQERFGIGAIGMQQPSGYAEYFMRRLGFAIPGSGRPSEQTALAIHINDQTVVCGPEMTAAELAEVWQRSGYGIETIVLNGQVLSELNIATRLRSGDRVVFIPIQGRSISPAMRAVWQDFIRRSLPEIAAMAHMGRISDAAKNAWIYFWPKHPYIGTAFQSFAAAVPYARAVLDVLWQPVRDHLEGKGMDLKAEWVDPDEATLVRLFMETHQEPLRNLHSLLENGALQTYSIGGAFAAGTMNPVDRLSRVEFRIIPQPGQPKITHSYPWVGVLQPSKGHPIAILEIDRPAPYRAVKRGEEWTIIANPFPETAGELSIDLSELEHPSPSELAAIYRAVLRFHAEKNALPRPSLPLLRAA